MFTAIAIQCNMFHAVTIDTLRLYPISASIGLTERILAIFMGRDLWIHGNSDIDSSLVNCYALHQHERVLAGVQMSDKRVSCDKTKETSATIPTLQERTIIPVLRQKWFVGDDPLYLIFRVKLTPFLRKRRYLTEFR